MRVGGDNAGRILAALTAFGFGSLGSELADFDRSDSIVQLGYPPYRRLTARPRPLTANVTFR